jgi:predicted RNase H-like HicB family nuclease
MPSYTVVLLAEEDGRYSAFVPALPGAVSWGDTVEDALANTTEAIEGLLEAMREDQEEIPVERAHTVVTSVTVRAPEPVPAVG